jgi:RNA polymerase sigma-70 factor (ECF subfamily)
MRATAVESWGLPAELALYAIRVGPHEVRVSGTETDRTAGAAHLAAFQAQRSTLVALAYRMLGDVGRAEDMVQEAWVRWQSAEGLIGSPRAYLVTTVTRLCLNELDSAPRRREESRSDRLPEPVELGVLEPAREELERWQDVAMAFLVVLQRLTPSERAVFLLHDAFDFEHREIAELVGRSELACRKLLERARRDLRDGRRMLAPSRDEHRRLLQAFVAAATAGDTSALLALLADDAVLVSDGGPEGRVVAGIRNLKKPLRGAGHVAEFVVATTRRALSLFELEEREVNGDPAVVFYRAGTPTAVLLLGIAGGTIERVFFHADSTRLGHVGARAGRR